MKVPNIMKIKNNKYSLRYHLAWAIDNDRFVMAWHLIQTIRLKYKRIPSWAVLYRDLIPPIFEICVFIDERIALGDCEWKFKRNIKSK